MIAVDTLRFMIRFVVLALLICGAIHADTSSPNEAEQFLRDFKFVDPVGRTYVDIIQQDAEDRFSIQFNSRGVCGMSRTVYRFKNVKGPWRVSGVDSDEAVCNSDGSVGVGTKYSANFLTGRVVKERFVDDKLVSRKVGRKEFPILPLRNFIPFGDQYRPWEER